MIKYVLNCKSFGCSGNNNFDGRFQSSQAFDKQKVSGLINCPFCGGIKIEKSLMAPSLKFSKNNETRNKLIEEIPDKKNNYTKSNEPKIELTQTELISILRSIKKEVQKKSEYVGNDFVPEVRAMHLGEIKPRSIYGNASKEKVEELKDEGIEVNFLPWIADDH